MSSAMEPLGQLGINGGGVGVVGDVGDVGDMGGGEEGGVSGRGGQRASGGRALRQRVWREARAVMRLATQQQRKTSPVPPLGMPGA